MPIHVNSVILSFGASSNEVSFEHALYKSVTCSRWLASFVECACLADVCVIGARLFLKFCSNDLSPNVCVCARPCVRYVGRVRAPRMCVWRCVRVTARGIVGEALLQWRATCVTLRQPIRSVQKPSPPQHVLSQKSRLFFFDVRARLSLSSVSALRNDVVWPVDYATGLERCTCFNQPPKSPPSNDYR